MHLWLHRIFLKNFSPILLLGVCMCFFYLSPSHAQTVTVLEKKSDKSAAPAWSELSAPQQKALKPLAALWPSMTVAQKRKWLAVSHNFIQLTDQEQITIQSRMQEWAALSPQQRSAARLNFAGTQQLPNEDKRAKWDAYQALSGEEKQKLAAQQNRPIGGGAPAIKPVAAEKLASPPLANSNKALPRIDTNQAAPATLLPTTSSTSATAPVPESPATQ
jgi:hypothetical protein